MLTINSSYMSHLFETLIHLFTISAIRYFMIAGLAFLLFYKLLSSRLIRSKIQSKSAARRDFIREILHSMQMTAVLAIIAYIVLFTPLKSHTLVYDAMDAYPIWWIPVSVVLSLVIHDTYFYWMHRFLHHKAIFRFTHLLHHKSTNPSPWTSYSFHFLEAWTEGAVLFVIVMIMPVHPLSILLFTVSAFIINVYGHLGYEIVPKGFRKTVWFEIFNTSVHHNLHHSRFKGNYGLYFRIWDRMLGTEHPDYVKEFDRIQESRFPTVAPGK